MQVYLVPYKVEDYKDLVVPLKIWPFPRGHFRGLTRVPVRVSSHRRCLLRPLVHVPTSGWAQAPGALMCLV